MRKIIKIGDTDAVAPQSWAIKGVIGGVSMVWGKPGTYKTFLATSMAVSVAAGKPWFGCRVNGGGPVIYLLGEGGVDMFRRRAGMAAEQIGVSLADIPLYVYPGAFPLEKPGDLDPYVSMWMEKAPVLIVVDTVSRSLPGDENKQETMQGFVACLDRLRDEFDATVLAIHHSDKAGLSARGSTVLAGAVDVEIRVKKERHGGERCQTLSAIKLRDMDTDEFVNKRLKLQKVDVLNKAGDFVLDEYGDKISTLVVMSNENIAALADSAASAFYTLKHQRGKGDAVGWMELEAEWKKNNPGRELTMLKWGMNEVLDRPEYDIMMVQPGHYDSISEQPKGVVNPFLPANFVKLGKNWDTNKQAERDEALAEIEAEFWNAEEEDYV